MHFAFTYEVRAYRDHTAATLVIPSHPQVAPATRMGVGICFASLRRTFTPMGIFEINSHLRTEL